MTPRDPGEQMLAIPDFLRDAELLAIDREKLCKHNPRCVPCGTQQVQLIDVGKQEWKCRHCKQTFTTDYKI